MRKLFCPFLVVAIFVFFLTPPHRAQQIRHILSNLSVWSWIKSAKLFRIIHDEFWSNGNGNAEIGSNDFYRG